ncbi:MAG: hypothetical protein KDI71_08695 [Xanthomonadales bacterium]|nr:hypothetical protein [Xanthomonadales bacterium]
MKLGLDIGRVIITPEGQGGDTSFLGGSIDDAMRTPPNVGMFEAVGELCERFGGQVWLVSKCGPRVQEKTRRWLAHHRFFRRTGIPAANLRFCLLRPQKAIHCRELGLTHFVDDRQDVLGYLAGVVQHRYLFGPQRRGQQTPRGLTPCLTWAQTRATIIADIESAGEGDSAT